MTFAGLVKHSLVDYPGLVACVVFVPGCNYDCYFCHNRHLLDGAHQSIPQSEVKSFLVRRAGLIDAVVVSGGEPTLQKGLEGFLKRVKDLGYRAKLDTNGALPDKVSFLIGKGLIDYVAVDYKAPAALYPKICGPGADAAQVRRTIDILLESGIPFEVRTTVLPELGMDELTAMARELPPLPRYVLNRYRVPERLRPGDEPFALAPAPSPERLREYAERLRAWQPNVTY